MNEKYILEYNVLYDKIYITFTIFFFYFILKIFNTHIKTLKHVHFSNQTKVKRHPWNSQ